MKGMHNQDHKTYSLTASTRTANNSSTLPQMQRFHQWSAISSLEHVFTIRSATPTTIQKASLWTMNNSTQMRCAIVLHNYIIPLLFVWIFSLCAPGLNVVIISEVGVLKPRLHLLTSFSNGARPCMVVHVSMCRSELAVREERFCLTHSDACWQNVSWLAEG